MNHMVLPSTKSLLCYLFEIQLNLFFLILHFVLVCSYNQLLHVCYLYYYVMRNYIHYIDYNQTHKTH